MKSEKVEVSNPSLWTSIAFGFIFMAGMLFMSFVSFIGSSISPKPATASKPAELHNRVYLVSYLLKDSNGNFGFGSATVATCNGPFTVKTLDDVKEHSTRMYQEKAEFAVMAVSLIEDTLVKECPKQE